MKISGFICEGPRCNKGHNNGVNSIQWDEGRLGKDPSYILPDSSFRWIIAQPVYEEPMPGQQPSQPSGHTFCSSSCLRDFYHENNYTPPRSPMELAKQLQNNKEVKEAEGKHEEV